MERRSKDEIEALNKAVKQALGTSKAGKKMAEILAELDAQGCGAASNKAHQRNVREALKACDAKCLGKTRAARWFAAKTVEKYGEAALTPSGQN